VGAGRLVESDDARWWLAAACSLVWALFVEIHRRDAGSGHAGVMLIPDWRRRWLSSRILGRGRDRVALFSPVLIWNGRSTTWASFQFNPLRAVTNP